VCLLLFVLHFDNVDVVYMLPIPALLFFY